MKSLGTTTATEIDSSTAPAALRGCCTRHFRRPKTPTGVAGISVVAARDIHQRRTERRAVRSRPDAHSCHGAYPCAAGPSPARLRPVVRRPTSRSTLARWRCGREPVPAPSSAFPARRPHVPGRPAEAQGIYASRDRYSKFKWLIFLWWSTKFPAVPGCPAGVSEGSDPKRGAAERSGRCTASAGGVGLGARCRTRQGPSTRPAER